GNSCRTTSPPSAEPQKGLPPLETAGDGVERDNGATFAGTGLRVRGDRLARRGEYNKGAYRDASRPMPCPAEVRAAMSRTPTTRTGLDLLCARDFAPLRGQRVGLVTHAAAVDSRLRPATDLLQDAPGVRLAALFGPEHGLTGTAQD